MKLKEGDLEQVHIEDFWYDLTLGGYIKPEYYLDEKKKKKLKEAIKTVQEFEYLLVDNDLIIEM